MPVTTCDACGLTHDDALAHRCAVDELRDTFAAAALTGMLADPGFDGEPDTTARIAYRYADAMIAERQRRRGGGAT